MCRWCGGCRAARCIHGQEHGRCERSGAPRDLGRMQGLLRREHRRWMWYVLLLHKDGLRMATSWTMT
jgi:hypothetical protein